METENLKFECNFCGKILTSKVLLQNHIRIFHEANEDRTCNVCNKTFLFPSQLNKHLSYAHDKRNNQHACDFCSKSFTSLAYYTFHINNYHTNKINMKCDICDTSFGALMYLKQHQKTHVKNLDERKKHICDLCKLAFQFPYHLKKHIENVHEKQRNFKCNHCFLAFSKKQSTGLFMAKCNFWIWYYGRPATFTFEYWLFMAKSIMYIFKQKYSNKLSMKALVEKAISMKEMRKALHFFMHIFLTTRSFRSWS